MRIRLYDGVKIKKGSTIIEGFPGFGLVGPITVEFLIEHLKTKPVGEFEFEELPPTAAIHKGKLVNPMMIHYSEKYNLIIMHTILNVKGYEWVVAKEINDLAKKVRAKEIISIEGVQSMNPEEEKVYYYGSEKFKHIGAEPVKESVILGVTGALILKNKNLECLFAPTASNLPDNNAAARIIKILDKYLGLDINPEPLLEEAKNFEEKLKSLMNRTEKANEEAEKKNLSYLG